jgi:selenide,water dikinase
MLAVAHGASACTDITGFGLLGHLLEMLAGVRGARLSLAQLPVLGGALDHLRGGIVSTMHAANERSARLLYQYSPSVDAARLQLVFDPQTSGGLLIALPRERARALCDALHHAGYAEARIIGEVTGRVDGSAAPVHLD